MPNARRFLRIAIVCLLFGWLAGTVARATGGPEGSPEAAGLQLSIERPNEVAVDARAKFATVTVKAQYGRLDLDLAKVHSVTIDKIDGDKVAASVEMMDHSRMSGELLSKELAVESGGTNAPLVLQEGLKIKFVHPKNTGLVAVLVGLLTLTIMEIVLGVDNIIFLAIVAAKLPEDKQPLARRIGLAAALGTRILLLLSLTWLMGATKPLFTLPELPFLNDPEARGISIRDLVLFLGGLFLVAKSTKEIHEKVAKSDDGPKAGKKTANFWSVIVQIAIIDIIFSLDSVVTAVGMVEELWIMITAMLIAVAVMVIFAEPISRFVDRNPSIKILALSFLILIGALLVAEGLGQHIDKGYIYFAMAFAVVIEFINMKLRPKTIQQTVAES